MLAMLFLELFPALDTCCFLPGGFSKSLNKFALFCYNSTLFILLTFVIEASYAVLFWNLGDWQLKRVNGVAKVD